jgi:nicotinate phosphoribosyltransferase
MAAGYFLAGKHTDRATFELSIRRLPPTRNFLLAAGMAQMIDYLTGLHFTKEEIDYLRSLKQFARTPPEFFSYLRNFRFTGDVFAVLEGTPIFAGEPVVIVRAPLIEAQLIETYLLSTIAFQTTIASKAVRCVLAANGRSIVEFGSRRAHSPEAGPLAGRAAFLAGCAGTSNTEAGLRYGIPVFGTAAHSWVMSSAMKKPPSVNCKSCWARQQYIWWILTTHYKEPSWRLNWVSRCGVFAWIAATWQSTRARFADCWTIMDSAPRKLWLRVISMSTALRN